jgi:hypothetical protein
MVHVYPYSFGKEIQNIYPRLHSDGTLLIDILKLYWEGIGKGFQAHSWFSGRETRKGGADWLMSKCNGKKWERGNREEV